MRELTADEKGIQLPPTGSTWKQGIRAEMGGDAHKFGDGASKASVGVNIAQQLAGDIIADENGRMVEAEFDLDEQAQIQMDLERAAAGDGGSDSSKEKTSSTPSAQQAQ